MVPDRECRINLLALVVVNHNDVNPYLLYVFITVLLAYLLGGLGS